MWVNYATNDYYRANIKCFIVVSCFQHRSLSIDATGTPMRSSHSMFYLGGRFLGGRWPLCGA